MTSRTTLRLCCAAMACLTLVSIALAGPTTAPASASDVKGDPYLLSTCPVSGEKLGSMGDPVVKTIDGREVRFCCNGCVRRFKGNTAKYLAVVDKAIVEQQMPFYPVQTCVVSGESLIVKGKDIGVNHVYKNRLVRFDCEASLEGFNKDPAGYIAKLDKALAKMANLTTSSSASLYTPEQEETRARVTPASIKRHRSRLKLSQAELGTLLDVSTNTIVRWEAGTSNPRVQHRAALIKLRDLGRRDVTKMLDE
ncbi:MAG: helix-turn-helix transcriptional regulator [Gemmatimonadetes bacterium]|nr:helix-turn-helix transcriptional regulator [Gemmatimonadota bacterium]